MKVVDAVFQSLTGDGLLTDRDEKGLYAHWDAIEIDCTSRQVWFKCKGQRIGTVPHNVESFTGLTMHITDLEGRLRIKLGD